MTRSTTAKSEKKKNVFSIFFSSSLTFDDRVHRLDLGVLDDGRDLHLLDAVADRDELGGAPQEALLVDGADLFFFMFFSSFFFRVFSGFFVSFFLVPLFSLCLPLSPPFLSLSLSKKKQQRPLQISSSPRPPSRPGPSRRPTA